MAKITWKIVSVKLSQLSPWEGNPKTSTGKQAGQLNKSHDELGQFQTVAIGPTNGDGRFPVYDGHQRLTAWRMDNGLGFEIQALQSSRPLTETERRKIAIYSRQIGAWDWDIISGWEPVELTEWGFDGDLLTDWRRDVASLGNFLESEVVPDFEPVDESEQPRLDQKSPVTCPHCNEEFVPK